MTTMAEIRARKEQLRAENEAATAAATSLPNNEETPEGDGGFWSKLLNMGEGSGLEAGLVGARQGLTFGFGDELNARLRAIGSSTYEDELARERSLLDRIQQEHGGAYMAGQIGGGILPALVPGFGMAGLALRGTRLAPAAGKLADTAAKVATRVMPKSAVGKAAVVGGTEAGVQGFGEGEGGFLERLENAGESAAGGALFGAGVSKVLGVGADSLGKLARKDRPTIEALQANKNKWYKEVEGSGIMIPRQGLRGMMTELGGKIRGAGDYDPTAEVNKPIEKLLTNIQTRIEEGAHPGFGGGRAADEEALSDMSIGQLDKFRQDAWDAYKRSAAGSFQQQGGDSRMLDVVNAIDDVIDNFGGEGSELLGKARDANRRYRKAQMLDFAMEDAERRAASEGSGGNVNNKYRQAINNILRDPNKRRGFTPEELQSMDTLSRGKWLDNQMRRGGKLAPGGNGLMLALLTGGAVYGGTGEALSMAPIAIGAAAQGLKTGADMMTEGRFNSLIDNVSGRAPAPRIGPKAGSMLDTAAQAGVRSGVRNVGAEYGPSIIEQVMPQRQMTGEGLLQQRLREKLAR